MINAHRVFFPPWVRDKVAAVFERERIGVADLAAMIEHAREITPSKARELTGTSCAPDRFFLQMDDRARGTMVFELRDNPNGDGHTLVEMHRCA